MPFRDLTEEKFSNTEFVNVKEHGAKGDGIYDDSAAITTAINEANGATLLLPVGTYKLSGNVIVPSNVAIRFINGAKLSIDSGITFTINGKLDAGLYQIFSGTGSVSITKGSVIYLLPQWWGTIGDGTNDDTSAIQSAINCASAGGIKRVFLSPGTYMTTAALTMNNGVHLIGAGKYISTIMVTGGGNGIEVTRVNLGDYYEGSRVADLGLCSTTTPVAGYGISIIGDRSVDIDNVHIGGWYTATPYGFIRGIYVTDQPAYYTTIRRCALFRNTYGVYINAGANEARVIDNEIWYGDYGIYVGTPQIQIKGNSIEGYTTAGVITCSDETIIDNNRFESIGVYSVILNPGAHMASITNSHGQTGLGNTVPVLNLSGENTHRIGNSFIPIGENSTMEFPAGQITSGDISNYRQSNVHIEANQGDLTLRAGNGNQAAITSPSVTVESQLDVASPSFSSPIAGIGNSADNLIADPANWESIVYSGTVTVTPNASIAPDGYSLTATKALSVGSSNNVVRNVAYGAVAGKMYQFSVWLRGDTEQSVAIYLWEDNIPLNSNTVVVGTEWKRYSIFAFCDATITYFRTILNLASGYPLYIWGPQLSTITPITGTDNSGINGKLTKLMDSTKDFVVTGINIGGVVCISSPAVYSEYGYISDIRTTLDFSAGLVSAPAVGATVTGETSTATGVVTDVVITGGSFAGNDAVGYLEVNSILGAFTAENITWTGGSCTCTDTDINDVLYFGGLTDGHGGIRIVDNGASYAVCSSYDIGFKPYVSTGDASISVSTTPVLVAPKIYSNGGISAKEGYSRNVKVINPFSQTTDWERGYEYYILNPSNNGYIMYLYHSGLPVPSNGDMVTFTNISSTYSFDVYIMNVGVFTVNPYENIACIYSGAWYVSYLGSNKLSKTDDVTFNSVTATTKVSGKTINGAVKPLVNQATIACDMNDGNVFTLSTTSAVGAVTINASNGTAGQTVTFIITDDTTGGHVVTFGTNFKSKGTLTGTSDKTATISFVYYGTNFYEVSRTTEL